MSLPRTLLLTVVTIGAMALPAFARDHGRGGYGHPSGYYSGYHGGYHGGPRISLGFGFGAPYLYPAPVYPAYPPYSYSRTYIAPVAPAPVSVTPRLAADVQSVLARNGYYRGAIDGVLGPASQAAIRAWQVDRHLPITGGPDSVTLRSMGLLY